MSDYFDSRDNRAGIPFKLLVNLADCNSFNLSGELIFLFRSDYLELKKSRPLGVVEAIILIRPITLPRGSSDLRARTILRRCSHFSF